MFKMTVYIDHNEEGVFYSSIMEMVVKPDYETTCYTVEDRFPVDNVILEVDNPDGSDPLVSEADVRQIVLYIDMSPENLLDFAHSVEKVRDLVEGFAGNGDE